MPELDFRRSLVFYSSIYSISVILPKLIWLLYCMCQYLSNELVRKGLKIWALTSICTCWYHFAESDNVCIHIRIKWHVLSKKLSKKWQDPIALNFWVVLWTQLWFLDFFFWMGKSWEENLKKNSFGQVWRSSCCNPSILIIAAGIYLPVSHEVSCHTQREHSEWHCHNVAELEKVVPHTAVVFWRKLFIYSGPPFESISTVGSSNEFLWRLILHS